MLPNCSCSVFATDLLSNPTVGCALGYLYVIKSMHVHLILEVLQPLKDATDNRSGENDISLKKEKVAVSHIFSKINSKLANVMRKHI